MIELTDATTKTPTLVAADHVVAVTPSAIRSGCTVHLDTGAVVWVMETVAEVGERMKAGRRMMR